ncbi:MAG: ABC transporter substrate-binding protein, partial [Pseudomonadota bacterium]|nr:ABC transporter substrate-binding protein [Pseudomonadota bacterium]
MRHLAVIIVLTLAFLTSGQSAAADKMTVLLDWFINPDHAPLYVGLERGYFREAGLDIEFIAPADPNDPPKLVAAGKADLAISYQPQLHMHADLGLPLVRIATLVATPLNSLVVLQDGPIRSISDLKGKTIGFSVGGFEDAMLRSMLQNNGLTLKDINLVNVNFSLSPALISGKVDAVIGAYRNFELNQLDILKRPGRAFYVEEEGVPPYDELIVIANRKDIDNERLRKFVNAIERGVQYLVNHPKESWKLFIKGRKELNDELNRRAWRDTLPRFALRPGALDINRYKKFAEFL